MVVRGARCLARWVLCMADKAPRSRRVQSNEDLSPKVRASFLASDRTYGARRVWHDLLADGLSCGLHRIERLMRLQVQQCSHASRSTPRSQSRLLKEDA